MKLAGPTTVVKPGAKVDLKGIVDGLPNGWWASTIEVVLTKRTDSGWDVVEEGSFSYSMRHPCRFHFVVPVNEITTFRARVRPEQRVERAVSDRVRVKVARVDATASRTQVRAGADITVSADCGKVCAGKHAELQKKVDGTWHYFAGTRLNDRGKHQFTWNTVTVGPYLMRVVVGDRWAVSETVRFDVNR
ncbi:MAG: hypothetical protein ABI720_04700 [Actinomycetes bacterium]